MSRLLSSICALSLFAGATVGATHAHAQPWTEDAKLVSGDSAPEDLFGAAVSASGDTVVIGAPGRLAGAQGTGAAYVFVRNGASWTMQQKLVSSDAATYFGGVVAIAGDTIAISDSFNNTQRGAVYIFTRSGSTWTLQQKLVASDPEIGQGFGFDMAMSGETLLVAAPFEDEGGVSNVGVVYVFTRSGATWVEAQRLTMPALIASQGFGFGLAIEGDRAVIGGNDGLSTGRAVHVYERTGSTFARTFRIGPPTGDVGFFGFQLAVEGDRIMATSRGDDEVATNAGAAYVYELNVSNWIQVAKLLPTTTSPDGYGFKAAMEGDMIVLASTSASLVAPSGGAAQVFVREDTNTWTNLATLVGSDLMADSGFGQGIAIEGGSVLVGAWNSYRPPTTGDCGGRGQPPCPDPPTPPSGSAYEFVIGAVDTVAPVLDIPFDNITVEATSSAGGVATFAFTATDDTDGDIDAECTPASGSVFPLGDTLVTCTATDDAGNSATDSFTVQVVDTTDPDAVCTDVVTECTGELTSVATSCTATDAVDPELFVSSNAQASYPVSVHQYLCSATDHSGNVEVEQCTVNITDTVPPTCEAPETGFVACTDEGGVSRGQAFVQQHINQFEVADSCDLQSVNIAGPEFLPAGCELGQASTITVTVRDEVDNATSCSTDIVVYDNRAPTITVPASITLECDGTGGVSAGNGNVATWLADATSVDVCHSASTSNNAPALFGIGTTPVTFVGQDSCGNASDEISSVSVADTTAPTATCQNVLFECTGALTPVTPICGASDVCDGAVAVVSNAAPSYARGQYTFSCEAQDDSGNGHSASCQLAVLDTTAAVLSAINTVTTPVAPGTNVSMSATFTAACGPHTGTWTFGDGTTGAATVTEGAGSGSASGSHVYTTAGTYTLTLTLTDASGNVASVSHQSIVVTAPPPASTRGSVNGLGTIFSPKGAYRPNPNSSGFATFLFSASHPLLGGGFTPVTGATDFRILLPFFGFTTTSYESLTINGAHAKYRGVGRVNGASGFSFLMTVVDGQRTGGGGTDRLHMKVWNTSTGVVIYDNEPSVPDSANATAAIGSGSVSIVNF